MAYTLEEIQQAQEPNFEAPIPGQSLTTELGSRPWEQPPQYADINDVTDYYLENLFSSEGIDMVVSTAEMGDSAIDLAERLTMAGTQNGLHTVDVGVLVAPILIEAIKTVANFTDVQINTGDEEDENRFTESMSAVIQKRLSEDVAADKTPLPFEMEDFAMSEDEISEFEMDDESAMPEEAPSSGLMSRRV